jgi:hypothetical protein
MPRQSINDDAPFKEAQDGPFTGCVTGRSVPTGSFSFELLKLHVNSPSELRFEGTLSSERSRIDLKRRLEDIHERIVTDGTRTITVDVRSLHFVDSSAIRVFIDWVSRASIARYRLDFVIDRAITWQRLSFSVLKSMSPEFVELHEKERGVRATDRPAT